MIINLIIAIAVLLIGFNLVRRQFSFILNPLKRWGIRALRRGATILWKKPERGGGARATPPRIRYRE